MDSLHLSRALNLYKNEGFKLTGFFPPAKPIMEADRQRNIASLKAQTESLQQSLAQAKKDIEMKQLHLWHHLRDNQSLQIRHDLQSPKVKATIERQRAELQPKPKPAPPPKEDLSALTDYLATYGSPFEQSRRS